VTWISTTQPLGIAVNETAIYWDSAAGGAMSAPVAGTPVSTLFANPNDGGAVSMALGLPSTGENNLVIDSTSVYWTVNDVGYPEAPFVETVPFNGSGASILNAQSDIAFLDQALAVDSTNLYVVPFSIDPQGGECPDAEGIDVVPLNHGPMTNLQGPCWAVRLAVDSSQNLYWTDLGPPPAYLHPSVMTQSISSATATKIASAVSPYGIALYGGNLYWSDSGNIMVYAIGGSTSPSVLSTSTQPQDIVVDSSGVYWIDSGNAVMMVPLGGGTAQAIAQQQANVVALATNSTSVFWVNEGTSANSFADGAVMKVAK
jgi:hypothetical protein